MQKIKKPLKAIRAKCIDCCAGSMHEVRLCTATKCPLYDFRFGHNPYYGKTDNEDENETEDNGAETAESDLPPIN